ncbi:toxin-antitoxin system HicB family antitoxin [Saccharothrix australiensis]|uniref:HicB-like protein involved in pilus formation n=1 Tax=Saccharothrix australiensis TaxID=2072 RepID=A0A495W6T2_9PSEU|nr:toxin-antitoxin system HicB family antitoxin [Saccharothrix australiensis]RKT56525.1 HicB-like protein involved in pilus formation [Saccharothrix australiensis]
MDLTPFVDSLRRELATAAEVVGEDARALAERLTAQVESAARLTLLEALSAAAAEITRDLAPGSVDVRLRGRDPEFVVAPPPAEPAFRGSADAPPPPPPPAGDEDGAMTRINLRLAEHLKQRVEEAATHAGISVNAWLVRAASAALHQGAHQGTHNIGQHYTGWVR